MNTPVDNKRAECFIKDLKKLLKKHKALIELEEVSLDYYLISAYLSAIYKNDERIYNEQRISLGREIDPEV